MHRDVLDQEGVGAIIIAALTDFARAKHAPIGDHSAEAVAVGARARYSFGVRVDLYVTRTVCARSTHEAEVPVESRAS